MGYVRLGMEESVKIQNDDSVSRGMSQSPQPVQPRRQDSGLPAVAGSGSGEDRVEVSDRARALLVAADSLGKLPQIQVAKVEQLRQLLKSGSYQVSGEQIAEKILGDGLFA
jgi:negative regulator of flagellin synthesis FlgM